MLTKNFLKTGLIVFLYLATIPLSATNYYFEAGNKKSGNGSKSAPFADLNQISTLKLQSGDSVLLSNRTPFHGFIHLTDIAGSYNKPVIIASYKADKSNDKPATIDAKGEKAAILIENCSYITLENMELTANAGGLREQSDSKNEVMRCGVLVITSRQGKFSHIKLRNLHVKDVFFEEPGFVRDAKETKSANGTQSYGWGIRFINNIPDAELSDIEVSNCVIENVEHTGLKFTAHKSGIKNINVISNKILRTGGPGIQMSGVENGLVSNNTIDHSGSNDDSRKWGRGSGLWTWGTSNVIIEHNQFLNANGPGDSAGAHIDFNCNDIILQYNLSANNAGGFCEILGNNYNCAYRYNISVNDGYREKGVNGAFQEGKIFWLSGYVGNGEKPRGPYNSYFYNNTIYVKANIVAKVAVGKTAAGICMVNNIFVIEGESREVEGDQFVADKRAKAVIPNVVFENNLFLNEKNWPKSVLIQDQHPIYGNPEFKNAGGLKLTDYIPQNVKLVKDKGIEIPQILGDRVGLKVGLKVKKDILGHLIVNKPDMGAIETTP